MAINREVDDNRMGDSPGCHSVIELNDHPWVDKPTWGHERLQGVPLHKHMESLSSGRAAKLDMS